MSTANGNHFLRLKGVTSGYGPVTVLRDVSIDVAEGETVGIVGESGSGKSVTTQALLQLVRGAQVSGSARFDGVELLTLPPRAIR